MKVMSREGSCDAPHCIQAFSPTLTSALDGAKVIFVDSGGKTQDDEGISDGENEVSHQNLHLSN